jgi:hypothetical protein
MLIRWVCHRPRVADQLCFRGILIRLVTGASWVDIEAIFDHAVSDTTLRARRGEWIDAGVFDALRDEALCAFDRIVGLDLDDVALDGSLHKAPYGGEGTGPKPLIVGSRAGSGRLLRNGMAFRSAGRSMARTVMTCACSSAPSTRFARPVCSLMFGMLHLDRG